jgi:integrase
MSERTLLTDPVVRDLPLAQDGQYIVRDAEPSEGGLSGFFVVVGRKAKTYTVQYDARDGLGKRRSRRKKLGRHGEISCAKARAAAEEVLNGERFDTGGAADSRGPTLGDAWDRYRKSHLERKGRSQSTIRGYQESLERHLSDWLDVPLLTLAENPHLLAERHDAISRKGIYAANHAMRAIRAVYNHAAKQYPVLSRLPNPALAVDWNQEYRRDTAMAPDELADWYAKLRALPNPVRQEFHLFMLLSAMRPDALRKAQWDHLDLKKRALHVPQPKGGSTRAFDLPLSREMIRSLCRARRAGRVLAPERGQKWIFPAADTKQGHIAEYKEKRHKLPKWGGDLRQTWRTLAQRVGVDELTCNLIMNHKTPGVNAGYITRDALWAHLLEKQEQISQFIMANAKGEDSNHAA